MKDRVDRNERRKRLLRTLNFWSLLSAIIGFTGVPNLLRGVTDKGGLSGYLSVLAIVIVFGLGGLISYVVTLLKIRAGRQ
jgi:hypothetical protein